MTGDDTRAADSFTIKEIVLSTQEDIRDVKSEIRQLAGKLDGYVGAHEARHGAEQSFLANQHADPVSTPAGKQLLADIDHLGAAIREEVNTRAEGDRAAATARNAIGVIVDRHETLIQRIIGAGSIVTVIFTIYEALRQARIIL